MFIEQSCLCGKVLQVEEHVGASVHCPACGAVLPAPAFAPALALEGAPASKDEDADEDKDADEEEEEDEDEEDDEDEDEEDVEPVDGLATPTQLMAGALLAGPITGGVLLARNYWKLGRPWAGAATLAGCLFLVLVPAWLGGDNQRQVQGLAACVWISVAVLAYALQASATRQNSEEPGTPASVGLVIKLGLVCVSATVGLAIFIESSFADGPDEGEVPFGKGKVVAYSAPVTQGEALALGKYLQARRTFDNIEEFTVRLRHRRGAYVLSIILGRGWNDPEMKAFFRRLASGVSEGAFDGQPVRIRLCKEGFRPVSAVSSPP